MNYGKREGAMKCIIIPVVAVFTYSRPTVSGIDKRVIKSIRC